MKKNLFTILLMLTVAVLLCSLGSCVKDNSDLPSSIDTTDNTPSDTTAETTADTTKTPDTDTQPSESKMWEDLGMTEKEWNDFTAVHEEYFSESIHTIVMAMLTGDVDTFAKNLGAPAEVYEYVKDMKFGDYKLYTAKVPAKDDPLKTRKHPVFEVEVKESSNSFFPVGTNRLVFIPGIMSTTVKHVEDIEWYADNTNRTSEQPSKAQKYVNTVISDLSCGESFDSILEEGKRDFGLADFIIMRLSELSGYSRSSFTEAEIRGYAEKYLGIDGGTVKIKDGRVWYNEAAGGYEIVGRGGTVISLDYVSEEILEDITVVTVRFYADYSETVQSRVVEFHLKQIDDEYSPVKTVIIEDSEYTTASFHV